MAAPSCITTINYGTKKDWQKQTNKMPNPSRQILTVLDTCSSSGESMARSTSSLPLSTRQSSAITSRHQTAAKL